MDIESLIRFACVTTPGVGTAHVALSYLRAIEKTGLGVRVMPIGAMHFSMPPWNEVSHLFVTTLAKRFINVVAVEPGLPMGAPVSTAQFGHARGGEGAAYVPDLALSALFTVGVPNVAILSGETMPEGKEVEALKHYTAVVCRDESGVLALNKLGVPSIQVDPNSDQLHQLFSDMNPV